MPNYKHLGNDFFIGPEPTEQDLADARLEGVRTVIDLRTPLEQGASTAALAEHAFAEAESMGFNLRHSPGFAAFLTRVAEK